MADALAVVIDIARSQRPENEMRRGLGPLLVVAEDLRTLIEAAASQPALHRLDQLIADARKLLADDPGHPSNEA
jgi:hypothetical protein